MESSLVPRPCVAFLSSQAAWVQG